MSYKLFDNNGNQVDHYDLQAKKRWCKEGERIEEAFISKYGKKLGLIINPEKETNRFAPDLLYNSGNLADLKTQNTPFFSTRSLYKIDPTYAVVFNRKDAVRYYKNYPNIIIYFWVEWYSVAYQKGDFYQEVEYINGVFKIPFRHLVEILKKAPLHKYQQRVNDKKGNAKSSYVLDIRDKHFERVI